MKKISAGEIMKAYREKMKLSQDAVANFLNIKREMVSYYETGARDVPLEVLEKLSNLFGIDLEVFFNESQEEIIAELALAFRADELDAEDLESIAAFRKIIKNYQRMINLEEKNA